MRAPVCFVLSLLVVSACAWAQSSRFIVDDDAYGDKVTAAASKLLRSGKLLSQETLRAEVKTKGFAVKLAPPGVHKFTPPDLYEKLRQSTFAVGLFYKCPDCGEWHFNSSTGFVVSEGGILCTCCHVVVEQDETIKESYVLAADADGHVFPVRSVLAADTDADTCFLRIDARGLQPLPFRFGARTGERVYCLSHPGGYYFMFTEGMIARLNRRPNDALNDHDQSLPKPTRPVLFLNVTAEFAPGSSGAPIVDEAGNVVGQVASIVDAGEPEPGDEQTAASPSVAIRFCTAAEEIQRLTDPYLSKSAEPATPRPKGPEGKPKIRKLRGTSRPCRWCSLGEKWTRHRGPLPSEGEKENRRSPIWTKSQTSCPY